MQWATTMMRHLLSFSLTVHLLSGHLLLPGKWLDSYQTYQSAPLVGMHLIFAWSQGQRSRDIALRGFHYNCFTTSPWKMAKLSPNFNVMLPSSVCIQLLLEVKVNIKGTRYRHLFSTILICLVCNWPVLDQSCIKGAQYSRWLITVNEADAVYFRFFFTFSLISAN